MVYDITIVGGGIIGLSTAFQLLTRNKSLSILVLEKEIEIATHQTGHNSGVIHSGIYYKPDSLKAKNCRYGIKLLIEFCKLYEVPYEICGKLIVATKNHEIPFLDALFIRGQKNGIKGLVKIESSDIGDYEPYVKGKAAIYSPETGIIDYKLICKKLEEIIKKRNQIKTNQSVVNIKKDSDDLIVITNDNEYKTKFLINCAGLFSDKITQLSGLERFERIIPFRGEYYMLKNESKYLVKNLIYPVPNPKFPFLGVHFTRTISGNIEAGPNAVLAFAREGYKKTDFNLSEVIDYLGFKGFWSMANNYWKIGLGEQYRSLFKYAFVNELKKLVPEIEKKDIESSPAGVRAQALNKNGFLIDDFIIKNYQKMIHVINAPSPAATSSLAIGEYIANLYFESE